VKVDKRFRRVGRSGAAQRCADRFAKLPWPEILGAVCTARQSVLHAELRALRALLVHDQREFALRLFSARQPCGGVSDALLERSLNDLHAPRQIFCYLDAVARPHSTAKCNPLPVGWNEPETAFKKHFIEAESGWRCYDKWRLMCARGDRINHRRASKFSAEVSIATRHHENGLVCHM